MELVDPRTSIAIIDRAECLRLLATEQVGRVAVVTGSAAHVAPVNYTLDGELILFRTGDGAKLTGAIRGRPVTFEVDRIDPAHRTGWSVIARGTADEVTTADPPGDVKRLWELAPEPWAPGDRQHLIRIRPEVLSGRRVGG